MYEAFTSDEQCVRRHSRPGNSCDVCARCEHQENLKPAYGLSSNPTPGWNVLDVADVDPRHVVG